LVMLDAVSEFNLKILIPVAIGAGVGLLAFSRILSWVFKHYRDMTIALMTGFIVGSMAIIWPWKTVVPLKNEAGELILKKGKEVVAGYDWNLPDFATANTWIALAMIVIGGLCIYFLERGAAQLSTETN
jgi:putative membrane protein